jgi:ABC-type polysaccharide/polyol phosphate transport system ATPase subunit
LVGASEDTPKTSKNYLLNSYFGTQKRQTKSILENLNFSIFSGQRVAILGANGAGKTSLLRLIAGNIEPSAGELSVKGSTHSLFNLQMGMHPMGTGRENIFLRGLQLGMSIDEIREKIEAAIRFTDLGDNINRRFSTYSAGMKLRLAIAITLMPNPDILIMDEWIGAGDKTFTKRLSDRLNEYINDSSGLVIASHNMNLIKRICTHGILLDKGQQIAFGKVAKVIAVKNHLESKTLRENNV